MTARNELKMGSGLPAVKWLVSGRVQGVGFRWFTLREAERLGVHGWVSNLSDGRVEVVATGSAEDLAMLDAALREGPSWGRVEHVEKADYPHEVDNHKPFSVR